MPVIILLSSADEVFLKLFKEARNLLSIDVIVDNIFGIIIMFAVGFIAPYALTKYLISGKISVKEGNTGNNEPIIAIIITSGITILYIIFSLIQIVYLFMRKGTIPFGH